MNDLSWAGCIFATTIHNQHRMLCLCIAFIQSCRLFFSFFSNSVFFFPSFSSFLYFGCVFLHSPSFSSYFTAHLIYAPLPVQYPFIDSWGLRFQFEWVENWHRHRHRHTRIDNLHLTNGRPLITSVSALDMNVSNFYSNRFWLSTFFFHSFSPIGRCTHCVHCPCPLHRFRFADAIKLHFRIVATLLFRFSPNPSI